MSDQSITTAILKYHNEDRIPFQICAEFLRFSGIFVDERLCTKDAFYQREDENVPGVLVCIISKDNFSLNGTFINSTETTKILNTLYEIWKGKIQNTAFDEAFSKLRDIFAECELVQACCTVQYYRYNTSVLEEAAERFIKAAKELDKYVILEEEILPNQYLQYARLFCLQRANLARSLQGKPVAYFIDILGKQCDFLIDRFPAFTNALVLKGFIFEFVNDYVDVSLASFEKALEKIGDKPYASSIYYWMGRRCEGYSSLKNKLELYYTKACQTKEKYRNLYKKAYLLENQEKWLEAIAIYEKSIEKIKEKGDNLDPLEIEYYFKMNVRIGYIYIIHLKDYFEGIDYAKEAERFQHAFKNRGNDLVFYNQMYGSDAKSFVDLSLSRMELKQTYKYIAKAYEKLNQEEEANYYRKLSQN